MSLFYAKPRPKIIVLALNYGFLFATATVATDTFMSPINDLSLLLKKLSVEVFETWLNPIFRSAVLGRQYSPCAEIHKKFRAGCYRSYCDCDGM